MTGMPPWSRRRILAGGAIVACVASVLAGGWTIREMDRRDAEHARFYAAGKSINGFLKEYCSAIEEAFEAGDPAAVMELYSTDYRAPSRGSWTWQPEPAEAGVAVSRLEARGGADYGRSELAEEIAGYLGGLSGIDNTVCKIDLVERLGEDGRAVLTVKWILDGAGPDGERLQDRSFLRWHLRRTGGSWRIVRDGLVEGVRVAGSGDLFRDVDPAELGIEFVHRRDPALDPRGAAPEIRFGIVEHASGGIAAADYDGDGRPDLFFADGVASRLYRNLGPRPGDPSGPPRFADVTEEAGLGTLGSVHSALFGDLDGDGDQDLFVARYLRPSRLYENVDGHTFRDRSAGSGLDLSVPASAATLLDYDRDGRLDLYLGVYGDAFREIPRLPFFARNGEPNRLFHNEGRLSFRDVSQASGTADTGWTLAVAAGDVDGDGWPDLAVANDFGRKSLFRNRGDGSFEETAKRAGVVDLSAGMGMVFADLDDDGDADLYTSNLKSNQRWYGEDLTVGHYLRNVLRTRWAVHDAGEYWDLYRLLGGDWSGLGQQIGEGNSLFLNRGDGTFTEERRSHVNQAGWSWSVAAFDYDNDTDQDLYAANGWITATPGTDL